MRLQTEDGSGWVIDLGKVSEKFIDTRTVK